MSFDVIIKEKEANVFIVEPVGEINTQTYLKLEEKIAPLLKLSLQAIIFELKSVTYISSMGLSAIFRTKLALEQKGGIVLLVNLQPQVKMVFETVKVLPDHMFASLEQADEYLDEFLDGVQKGKIIPQKPKI